MAIAEERMPAHERLIPGAAKRAGAPSGAPPETRELTAPLLGLEIPRRVQPLATAWLTLAVIALALSTVYALLLSVARTPSVGQLFPGVDLYRTALTLHVDLAVLIWFLACGAMFWSTVAPHDVFGAGRLLGWLAFGLAAMGTAAMVVSPLLARSTAVMSNYVPLLDNPVFLGGLGAFGLGLMLAGTPVLARGWPGLRGEGRADVMRLGIYLSLLPLAMALVSLMLTYAMMPPVVPETFFEVLFWGPGHLMQFSYVLLMMVSWLLLADAAGAGDEFSPRTLRMCLSLTAAPALAAPVIHLAFPAASQELRDAYTGLMAFGSWPAAAWMGMHLLAGAVRAQRATRAYDAASASLMLSVALFVFGCVAGAAIASNNVMITGHYHGTVGAVALALMGMAIQILPRLGLAAPRSPLVQWQPVLYGGGLLLLALGLVWSGLYNVQRKVPGSGLLFAPPETLITLAVVGAGGLIAFIGTLGCALPVLRSILVGKAGSGETAARPRRADVRMKAVIVLVISVGIGGGLIAWLPGSDRSAGHPADPFVAPRVHADQQRTAEIRERFQQGVIMLHAKQYEHAVTAFHRVLQLAPDMPEAHVNLGYALIGLRRFGAARDFFESATLLRPDQANAYYGMALALDELGDRPGALGAMRTFVHRTKPGDPYLPKAQAALWEWEAAAAAPRKKGSAVRAKSGGSGLPSH